MFFLLIVTIYPLSATPEYELSVCAIFQNEAPYLREWLEFHLLVGVEHFYLYNNLSDDNYQEALEPYIEEGIVELFDWPHSITTERPWHKIQCAAYNEVLSQYGKKSKWMAFIDIDEFLMPVVADDLLEILDEFNGFGGIGVNWQLYGTSNIEKIPDNMLLVEALLHKAGDNHNSNRHVKSIVNPKRVEGFSNAHYAKYKNGYFSVDENYQQFSGAMTPQVSINKLRINHYWTRDLYYFHNVKIASRQKRGWSVEKDIESAKNLNAVYDPTILRFVPTLREALGYE